MKVVTLPEKLEAQFNASAIVGQEETKTIKFYDWLESCIDQAAETFGKGRAGIRKSFKILDAFEKALSAKHKDVNLEDDHYKCLLDAVEARVLPPRIGRACLAFYDAIHEAKDLETQKDKKD